MTIPHQPFRAVDFDGLVVEDANGVRVLALPAALVPALRSAVVIRFRNGDAHYSMRVDRFDRLAATQARDELAPAVEPPAPSGSAPTPTYGAPALPVHGTQDPSPAPPPASDQDEEDPANIPLRARRGGQWVNIYVTRAQYLQYEADGRIAPQAPDDTEGTDQ
ncbi:hypothetical protein ACIPWE_40330 [Streptomyces sp. NPDC090073]|uniref:hypothetical protein n=1 Tax=Streptomyces sp. NPDC090073 TaxID=3365936 RepID=UPI0037F3DA79